MPLREFVSLEIINRSIVTLFNTLTPRVIRRFTDIAPIKELYLLPWDDPVKETQLIARTILRYFGIKNSVVNATFTLRLSVPGQVKIGISDVFFVDIHAEYKNQRNVVIAILAHEVAHIFLHKHQIEFESTAENEILTDTTAAFLGFGPSMLNIAYSRTAIMGTTETTSEFVLGYLSVDEFGYVIAKRNHYLGSPLPMPIEIGLPSEGYESGMRLMESIRTQRPFCRRDFIDRACWWVKTLLFNQKATDDTPIIFDCQYCSQKLRIPSSRKTLQVKCSTCGSLQVCYS